MRLFYKIYFFLILLLAVILVGAGYVSYHREVDLFNFDMKKDALLLGEALSGMVEQTMKNAGAEKAFTLIRDANAREHSISIRWVNLDALAGAEELPEVPREKIRQVLQGSSLSLVIKREDRESYRFTYVPVVSDKYRYGAIELAESLSEFQQYTRNSLLHLFITGALIMLAAGLLLWLQFRKWIHQPLILFT